MKKDSTNNPKNQVLETPAQIENEIPIKRDDAPETAETAQFEDGKNYAAAQDSTAEIESPKNSTTDDKNVNPGNSAQIDRELEKIAQIRADIELLPEEYRRGLSIDTYKKFNVGYWLEKKYLLLTNYDGNPWGGKVLIPPSRRVRKNIKSFFLKTSRSEKPTTALWHAPDIDLENTQEFFIVEGEIDGMSLWQASHGTATVLCTGGAGNRKLVWKFIADNNLRGRRFVILFDNDTGGLLNAKKLVKEIADRGNYAVARIIVKFLRKVVSRSECFSIPPEIDANGALIMFGGEVLNKAIDALLADVDSEFKELEKTPPVVNVAAVKKSERHLPLRRGSQSFAAAQLKVNQIKYTELEEKGLLTHSEKGRPAPDGFCCECGSGHGQHQTGALGFCESDDDLQVTLWYCHACSEGGSVVEYLGRRWQLDPKKQRGEIVRRACEEFNLPPPAIGEGNPNDFVFDDPPELAKEMSTWQDANKTLIGDEIALQLIEAAKVVEKFETLSADAIHTSEFTRRLGLLSFYLPHRATKFFETLKALQKDIPARLRKLEGDDTAEVEVKRLRGLQVLSLTDLKTRIKDAMKAVKSEQSSFEAERRNAAADAKRQAMLEKMKNDAGVDKNLPEIDFEQIFSYGRTDGDFAKRIYKFYGGVIRLNTDTDHWLVFKAGRWENRSEKNSSLFPFTRQLADAMKVHAKSVEEEKTAALFDSAKKQTAAISLLRGYHEIFVTSDDLDKHPELLNVRNCVIDLTTGDFYKKKPVSELLFTRQAPVDFRFDTSLGDFTKFFEDIMPNDETRAGFLRWLGYCLTGDVSEEKFAIWRGDGGNGKGVIARCVSEMLGTFATPLPTAAFLKCKTYDADRATAALNSLEGTRFSISEELPQGAVIDAALIKNCTGGDLLTLRQMYREFHTVKPTAKINLSGNFNTRLENVSDKGILRRLINFPFTQSFDGDRRDPKLKARLTTPENLSALLVILVDEAVCYYRDGLIISSQMKAATQQYLSDSDFISDFIDDQCEVGEGFSVLRKALLEKIREAYPAETRVYTDKALAEQFEARGFKCKTFANKRGGKSFEGIRFAGDFKQPDTFDEFTVSEDDIPPRF